jgi:hypothetical protein
MVAGAHRLAAYEESQQIRIVTSAKIYPHYQYTKDERSWYDIAVIIVEDPFQVNDRVSYATIPPANMGSSGNCFIAGM